MGGIVTKKVAAAIGAALLLAVGVLWLVCLETGQQTECTARVAHARQVLAVLDGLASDLNDADGCRCSYVTHAEPVQWTLFQTAAARIRARLTRLQDLTSGDEVRHDRIESASSLVGSKLDMLERSFRLRQHARFNDRGQFALTHEVHGVTVELRRTLADLRTEEDGFLERQTRQTESSARYAGSVVAGGGLLTVLFFGLSAIGVSRQLITRERSWADARAKARQAEAQAGEHFSRLSETQAALQELASLRSHLEKQLCQAQRLASVGRVTSEVAHDFNNLLQMILGYSEASLLSLPADDPTRPFIIEVVQAGQRAVDLIRQLLGAGRVGKPGPLNLNVVVAELEPLLRRVAGQNVELVTTLDPALGRVLADRGPIDQVLLNLTANARDAMPDGGRLMFETRQETEGVLLIVTDTGCGMDAETRGRLFEPFFTTKEEGKGTGLGMAIVLDVVRRCGGRVEVESELGRGTVVRISLPHVSPGERDV